MTVLLYGTRPPYEASGRSAGDPLWLPAKDLPAATGFTLKPEGLCQDDRCVRIPHGLALVREDSATGSGARLDLTALAELLGQPVLHDAAHDVWCVGEAAPGRRSGLRSLQAPDFTLPDLDGRLHALRDYRGKKVLLISWASW